MKGLIRIGGALVLGILIVLVAVFAQHMRLPDASAGIVVAPAEPRTYIASKDSDGDGVKDWEEALGERVIDAVRVPTTTLTGDPRQPYTPPTTLTGKFSEAFFQDYLQGKISGEDFSDPTAFVDRAVTAIESSSQSLVHTKAELDIRPSTEASLHEYGNTVANIIVERPVVTADAPLILKEALDTGEATVLQKLESDYVRYAEMAILLLRTPVPNDIAAEHLVLVNTYEALATDLGAMKEAFTDPLYALARTKEYEDNVKRLADALASIGVALHEQTSYVDEEFGIFFSLFTP